MTSRPMNRAEAQSLGERTWGHGWQTRWASDLGISDRTVRRWIAADSVPDFAAEHLRALAFIAPPPGSTDAEDRDDACADAIEPELSRTMALALGAGWNRGEVLTAMLSLLLTDLKTVYGEQEAEQMLEQMRVTLLGGKF